VGLRICLQAKYFLKALEASRYPALKGGDGHAQSVGNLVLQHGVCKNDWKKGNNKKKKKGAV
jgi:hypothetical protein